MTHVLKDVYQSVTNQIITALEAGTPPWRRARRPGSALGSPAPATWPRPTWPVADPTGASMCCC